MGEGEGEVGEMKPAKIAKEYQDYLSGLFMDLDEEGGDIPDGAWFQMHLDLIEWAQSEEMGDLPEGDPHDIYMAYLEVTK